jgi:integrase
MAADGYRPLEGRKGVSVRHAKDCPALSDPNGRCRKDRGCVPRYRKRVGGKGEQRWVSSNELSEVLGATADSAKVAPARAERPRTFEDVAIEWWAKYKLGRVPKRRGAGLPSITTINGYRPLLFKLARGQSDPTEAPLEPDMRGLILMEWGHRRGDEITDREFQKWIDKMPWSRSRIDEIVAVFRGVYAYACRSTRAIWRCQDPSRNVQLPAHDKSKSRKLRVAQVPEARELLAALSCYPGDQPEARRVIGYGDELAMPYAMAVGTGLRRSEIRRSEWPDVLWQSNKIRVPRSKSEAGEFRLASISRLGMQYLKAEFARQGFPADGLIVSRSVISGKLGEAAQKAWDAENERRAAQRRPRLKRITLQEGRHTYASMLLAAGYTLAELMENMGHDDLAATRRYLKRLPQPDELNEADRLHNYEDGFAEQRHDDAQSM